MTEEAAPVGVVIVGHGSTASQLLAAAHAIVGGDALSDVVAVDAGDGETPRLGSELCGIMESADRGRGLLMIVDLLGASPCQCGQRESAGHELVVLSGLNLAMLLKLARLDRSKLDAAGLADACADSGRRAVAVTQEDA